MSRRRYLLYLAMYVPVAAGLLAVWKLGPWHGTAVRYAVTAAVVLAASAASAASQRIARRCRRG